MEPELDIEEALLREDILFIDVRSPKEYAEASIPGAVNIPLFQNDEHSDLGILYHQEGEISARRAALSLVAPQLPALVEQVTAAAGDKLPLLYCWRGGLRSVSLYQILNLSGVRTLRLKGGYKAYRRYVNSRLSDYDLKSKLLVLHGLTGVGKTAVLQELIKRGLPAVDLEGFACHRGSVFGAIGVSQTGSQKNFDSLLLQELDRFHGAAYLAVEGEGRRIGNIHLPPFLIEAMDEGDCILLTAPMQERVRRIVFEYLPGNPSDSELMQIRQAILSLRWRLGATRTDLLLQQLTEGNYPAAAEILCREYYDRLYSDAKPGHRDFRAIVDTTDPAEAADRIAALLIESKPGKEIRGKGVLKK